MKPKLTFLLSLLLVFSIIDAKNLTIQKYTSAPTIDGNGTEDTWTNISWQYLDQNKGEEKYKNNSAKFKMTYDDYFLYVLVNVEDAAIDTSQSANVWEKDGIELFITLDTLSHYFNNGKNDDWGLRKVFGLEMTDWNDKGHIALEQTATNGYTQEWKIVWDSLLTSEPKLVPFNGQNFKFEMVNNDNDGAGRLSQLYWNSIDETNLGINNNYFGSVSMASPIEPETPSFVDKRTLTIQKCSSAPTIDGKGDNDWADIAWETIDQHLGEEIDKNNTAKFKMTYDYNYLYLFVSIEDATIDTSQSQNVWEKDCVELSFLMDRTLPFDFSDGHGITYLRKIVGRDIIHEAYKDYQVIEQCNSGKYEQEWRLSWNSLISTPNYNNINFMFDIKNQDNDGFGRKSTFSWSTWEDYFPAINMGYIILNSPLAVSNTIIAEPLIRINSQAIEFTKASDFILYNAAGMVIRQGKRENGFNTSGLKKGLYIVVASGETKKFTR